MQIARPRRGPPTPEEVEDLYTLKTVIGLDMDELRALAVLRKHNGDLDKAAAELLEAEMGSAAPQDIFADLPQLEPLDAPGPGPRTPPPSKPEGPLIDLTKDEESELARALAASLEDSKAGSTSFGPSNRAPDPSWAMVRSNAQIGPPQDAMSQDEQAMSRAIEASLSDNIGEDKYYEGPLEERVRIDDTPVALRPTDSPIVYAALIIHGLYHIPQMRQAIGRWLPIPEPGATEVLPPTSPADKAYQMWTLLEFFCNMDLARLSDLNVDEAFKAFKSAKWTSPAERVDDFSARFYDTLANVVEHALQYNNNNNPTRERRRLMALQYGDHDAPPENPNFSTLCFVRVPVGLTPDANDLVSSLAAELTPMFSDKMEQVIYEPSEVIAFQLSRGSQPPSYDASVGRRTERETFKYPKSIYLDQFMRESFDLATAKRQEQKRLLAEVKELEEKKKSLLHFNDKDTIADLQSALHYYENIAESNDDPKRADELRRNKDKLTQIIEKIQAEVKAIDTNVERMRTEAQNVLDCPELQMHRYDLRVVLVHDGLFGRSHLYSYVKQKGQWWKTLDYHVTKVSEETVLTDATGLHLGAGPYFLIYSRAMSQEEEDAPVEWPDSIKNNVKHNNMTFLRELPPDVSARVADKFSPPPSPFMPTPMSEITISSDMVEPPESRDEPMEIE